MNRDEIQDLVEYYGQMLIAEYEAQVEANNAATDVERVEAVLIGAGYVSGSIDGKNAETRKAQERQILAQSSEYAAAREAQTISDDQVALNVINRKKIEALLSLTKAWLYSQSSIR